MCRAIMKHIICYTSLLLHVLESSVSSPGSDPGKQLSTYFQSESTWEDRSLTGHVINQFEDFDTPVLCAMECSSNQLCRSFNYCEGGPSQYTCELSDASLADDAVGLVLSVGCSYWQINSKASEIPTTPSPTTTVSTTTTAPTTTMAPSTADPTTIGQPAGGEGSEEDD
ncbi:uncharacterized protein [Ptychodera flava]|uniref:uncharacterized protein n=1 Tax=Ptychodera flava TaxID=63121 RepID=UPI00396A3969